MKTFTSSPTVSTFVPKRRALNEIDFCAWLAQAAPGDQLHYHHGFLALDSFSLSAGVCERRRAELVKLASCTFRAAEDGLVHLVQKRLGAHSFAYIAIARQKPSHPRTSLSILLSEEAA